MQEQLYAKPYDYYSSEGQATEVNCELCCYY